MKIIIIIGSILFITLMIYTYSLIEENEQYLKFISNQSQVLEVQKDSLQTLNDTYNDLQKDLALSIDSIAYLIHSSDECINSNNLPGPLKKLLNSKYIISLFSINARPSKRTTLLNDLSQAGFLVSPGYDYDENPSWMADSSTIFYYNPNSIDVAQEISEILSTENIRFTLSRGDGLGVKKGFEHLTFYIHYIERDTLYLE
ncbi:MAG: hypothetical protein AAF149_07855 [Bacteroidota bacterium]